MSIEQSDTELKEPIRNRKSLPIKLGALVASAACIAGGLAVYINHERTAAKARGESVAFLYDEMGSVAHRFDISGGINDQSATYNGVVFKVMHPASPAIALERSQKEQVIIKAGKYQTVTNCTDSTGPIDNDSQLITAINDVKHPILSEPCLRMLLKQDAVASVPNKGPEPYQTNVDPLPMESNQSSIKQSQNLLSPPITTPESTFSGNNNG